MPLPHEKQEIELPNIIEPKFKQYQSDPEIRDAANKLRAEKDNLEQLTNKQEKRIRTKKLMVANLEKQQANTKISFKIGKIIGLLEQDCSTAIADMLNQRVFLYRYVEASAPDMYKGVSRTDRKPSVTAPEVQKTFDTILGVAGYTALRENSISTVPYRFATAHNDNNKKLYIIFPCDGFSFTFSYDYSKISQFLNSDSSEEFIREGTPYITNRFRLSGRTLSYLINELPTPDTIGGETGFLKYKQEREKFIKIATQTSKLMYATKQPNTEAIKYLTKRLNQLRLNPHLPSYQRRYITEIIESFSQLDAYKLVITDPRSATEFLEYSGFSNQSFTKALISRNEVMIHGTYYAFVYSNETSIGATIQKILSRGV